MGKSDEKLYRAISQNNVKVVRDLLLNKKCSASVSFHHGFQPTPLIHCATLGNEDCLLLLLHFKAAVDTSNARGVTACMMSAEKGHVTCLEYLVNFAKAKVDLSDHSGQTALMRAATWGQVDCVKFLVTKVKDVDARDRNGRTALMHAATHGRRDCVPVLVGSRADPNLTDRLGSSPLLLAVENQHYACALELLRAGAHADVVNANGDSALSLAFDVKSVDYQKFVMALLEAGADVNMTSRNQRCLHEMVARGDRQLVRQMVLSGCAPVPNECKQPFFKFPPQDGPVSPLATAILSRHADIAKYLLMAKVLLESDLTLAIKTCQDGEASLLPMSRSFNEEPTSYEEVTSLLEHIQSQPLSLTAMSFVKVSSCVVGSAPGRTPRVMATPLPNSLREELAFRGPAARLCVSCWARIEVHHTHSLVRCNCRECHHLQGEAFNIQ